MKKNILTLCTGLMVLALASFTYAAPVELHLDKAAIEISTFYNGTTVLATGTVPAGSEAVVRVSGKDEALHLKKKGKVGGLLWMNTGDLTIENAPKIYLLYSSATGQEAIADPKLGVSLDSLRERIKILPENEDQKFFFNEFLKMKKHDAVYAEFPGTVTYSEQPDGARLFQASLQIPPRMSEDDYTIEVLAIKEGSLIGQARADLQVKMVGFPEQLARMAFQRSLLYGILSVLIAVGAGLFMCTVFRGKGGAH
ncbi:MAG: TIGR02186 family protein [Desulfobulbaceae bacterium]